MTLQVVVKVLGSGLVLMGGGLIGKHLAGSLHRRVRVLEDLRAAIQRLSTEVAYGGSVLFEAITEVSASSGPECRGFLETVARGLRAADGEPARVHWYQGVAWLKESRLLTPADAEVLALLGPSLGTSGREEQEKHLAATIDRLSVQVQEARKEATRFDTFYREMGVLVALAIVILLL